MDIDNFKPLLTYLKNTPREAVEDLTPEKIASRAENVTLGEDGVIEFEVERHHPVGGSQYRPGLPMSALITQRYRYTFDPQHQHLSSSPVGDPVWDDSEWDWQQLAEDNMPDTSFNFIEIEPSKYKFSEACCNFACTVIGVHEAVAAFRDEISRWDFSLSFGGIDGLREETKTFLCQRLRSECLNFAEPKIQEAWDDRTMLDD